MCESYIGKKSGITVWYKWTTRRQEQSIAYITYVTHCVLIRVYVYTRSLLYKAEPVLAVVTLPVGIVYVPLRCIWLG